MGILTTDLEQWAKSQMEQAEELRDDLRKQESPTYVALIDEVNTLTYEPVPFQQRYEMSVDLVRGASLADWERDDLIAQIERIYGELLEARPYDQVRSSLQNIQSGDFPRERKLELSMQLLQSYNLPDSEVVEDMTREIRRFYKAE